MSRLPQLEAQLVAAAGRPRARRRLRVAAAAALAVAACIAAVLMLAPSSKPREQPAKLPQTVPAATLVKARALAQAPKPRNDRIPAGGFGAAAERFMAQTPYPPGMSDDFDYARARSVQAETTEGIQGLVEYRAYCLWMIYWARGSDRASATTVLRLTPQWPTRRSANGHLTGWQHKIMLALRKPNLPVLETEAKNCAAAMR